MASDEIIKQMKETPPLSLPQKKSTINTARNGRRRRRRRRRIGGGRNLTSFYMLLSTAASQLLPLCRSALGKPPRPQDPKTPRHKAQATITCVGSPHLITRVTTDIKKRIKG
jgi:hypothetical protein